MHQEDQSQSVESSLEPSALPVAVEDQTAPVSLHGGEFKLLNAYLIDSLSPGRIVEMGLDGGAVLTGVNGRGKTSMLQLLLMFNGTNPSSLVSKGKSSFIDYYLPRSTSFIAFEYQRDDGSLRMVVAYPNSTADKVFYRFVRQGFESRLFVGDDGRLVKNRDFRARLAELKVSCSQNQIETYTDYRAVIHYNIPAHADKSHKSYLRGLCSDYAFTRYNKPLTNMDRLGVGMFSRKANFDVLQSIVIESIFDSQTSHSIKMDRNQIELWPRNYRAYTDIMALRSTYDEACAAKVEFDQDIKNLSGLREQVQLLLADFDRKEAKVNEELTEKVAERKQAYETYKASNLALETEKMQSQIKGDDLAAKIKDLDEAKAQYDELDIPAKMIEYKSIDEQTKKLASLTERLDTLTASHAPLVAKYNIIMSKIRDEYSALVEINSARGNEVREHFAQKLKELETRLDEQELKLEAIYDEKRKLLQGKVDALIEQFGYCKQNLNNPQVPQEILDALQKVDLEVTENRKVNDDKAKDEREKEILCEKAQTALDNAKAEESRAKEQVNAQKQKVEAIIEANTPHPESLLFFLRNEVPQWRADIARVLRTDVLHRTDLSPVFGDKSRGIYGLELNLNDLDAAVESDPEYIALQVKDEENRLAAMQEKLVTLGQAVEAHEKTLKQLTAEKSAASKARLEAKSKLQVSEAKKDKAIFEIEQAKKSALANAQKAFDTVVEELQKARDAVQQAEEKERQEKLLRKTERLKKTREVTQECDAAVSQLSNELKAKETQRDIALRDCDRECEQALREQGVDAETLETLKRDIESVKARIAVIETLKPLMSKWVPWHREVYCTRDSLIDSLDQERARLEQISLRISESNDAHHKADSALAVIIEELESSAKELVAMRNKGLTMTERLREYTNEIPTYTEVDESWTMDGLHQLMAPWFEQLETHRKAMDKHVYSLKKGFERYTNTSVHEFYEDYRRNHDTVSSPEYIEMFSAWYELRHKDIFDLIRSKATLFSNEVADFHRKLKTFTDHLNRFNRDLQEHLFSLNNYFKDIDGLTVNIHSTVNELKSWGVISRMVESRPNWINKEDELPDALFVEGLEQLLEQWDVKNGITADFKHLISIRGEVRENGNLRKFKSSQDLDDISSHGLSYLILIILFVAFWKKIKKDSPVNLIWALDELKVISANNIDGMMRMLKDNSITLCSAFPDPDVSTLSYFKHAYTVAPDRRLATVKTRNLGALETSENV